MKDFYIRFITIIYACLFFVQDAQAQLSCSASSSQIEGTVFRELVADGTYDSGEELLDGVTVTAYDDNGQVASATTVNGAYTFSGLNGGTIYRVEFSWSESFLYPSPVGNNSNTSVRFLTPGNCANLGLHNPADFCANPSVWTPCYVNGDPTQPGSAQDAEWLVLVEYPPGNTQGLNQYIEPTQGGAHVGTVWGGAFQRSSQTLFTSAFLKRHSGLGDGGPGQIYLSDMTAATSAAETFIDLAAAPYNLDVGVDPRASYPPSLQLPTDKSISSHDPDAFDAVGKLSFGDLDISDDESTLWLINLTDGPDRGLIEIEIGVPYTTPSASDVTVHGLPAPPCNNGVFRAFAIEYHRGEVYIGGVCTGENGGNAGDLVAYIYKHDPNGADGNFTQVFSFDLDYPRGFISDAGSNKADAEWRAWIDDWNDITNPAPGQGPWGQVMYPQPMLTDMEFIDDGSIIVALSDRFGHQGGNKNYSTDPNNTATYEAAVAGDVLRIFNDGGTYRLEDNAGCPSCTNISVTPTNGQNQNPGQGPGGGEFYWQDMYRTSTNKDAGTHDEITTGSLVFLPGSGEVGATVYDPLRDYRAAGFQWYSNSTGELTRAYEIFGRDGGSGQPRVATFGKAASLGDMEIFCDAAPVEIGNYVWRDLDGDGIQDPSEQPLQGINVNLYVEDPNNAGTFILIGQSTTNSGGEYLFNADNVAMDGVSAITGNPLSGGFTGLDYGTTYYISINDPNQFDTGTDVLDAAGKEWMLTTQNAGANDEIDSDAALDNTSGAPFAGYPTIVANVGASGQNDHSFDFGFFEDVCDVLNGLSASSSALCEADPSLSITISHPAGIDAGNQFRGVYSTTPLTETDLYDSNLGTAFSGSPFAVTPSQNFTVASGLSLPTTPDTYYLYAILEPGSTDLSATCRPVVSTTVEVNPLTPTVTVVTPLATVCTFDDPATGGTTENVIDLNTLLSGTATGGVWSTTDPISGTLSGSVFTASSSDEDNTYAFTYTIPGSGGAPGTACGDQTYVVNLTVGYCPCDQNEVILCEDETVTIAIDETVGGSAPYSNIVWYNESGDIASLNGQTSITIDPAAAPFSGDFGADDNSEEYYYTATDRFGCAVELFCRILVRVDPPAAVVRPTATICDEDLGNNDNEIDLSTLITGGATNGTWSVLTAGFAGQLSGSVFTAQDGDAGNVVTVRYTVSGGVGVCEQEFDVNLTIEECCPELTELILPDLICFEDVFSISINHTQSPGLLSIYYNSGAVLTTANDVYNNAIQLVDNLSATGMTTVSNGNSLAPGTYNIYAVLDSDNSDVPPCVPLAVATMQVDGPPPAVAFNTAPAICSTPGSNNDNEIDLNTLLSSVPMPAGVWAVVTGNGSLSGSTYTAAASDVGTVEFSYTVSSTLGACNDEVYLVGVPVEDCTCPILNLSGIPTEVCSDASVNLTINHSTNPGDLALFYLVDDGVGLTANELYGSPFGGSATQLGSDITPTGSSTTVSAMLPANTTGADVSYLLYAILADGNSNISDPDCLPVALGSIRVLPETADVTGTTTATICEQGFGNDDNVMDLNTLLDGGVPTNGVWSDDDNSGGLIGSFFTATPAMANQSFDFTYTIAGSGSGDCADQTLTVTITVDECLPADCPVVFNAFLDQNNICGTTVDLTINHDAGIGDLAVFLSTTTSTVAPVDFYADAGLSTGGTFPTVDLSPYNGSDGVVSPANSSVTTTTLTLTLPVVTDGSNPEYFVFVGLANGQGGSTANSLLDNPYCLPLLQETELRFTQYAPIDAGEDQTVCSNDAVVTLEGDPGGSTTTGMWTGGNGTFNPDANTLDATYTPTVAELNAGFVDLTLVPTNSLCTGETDVVRINYTPAPALLTANVCAGESTQMQFLGTPAITDPFVSSDETVATISSTGEVTALMAGQTTITFTDDSGCTTRAVVNVNDCGCSTCDALTGFVSNLEVQGPSPDPEAVFSNPVVPYCGTQNEYPSPLTGGELAPTFGSSIDCGPNTIPFRGLDETYQIVVGGNFTVPASGGAETEGRVAVGGNMTIERDYGVSQSGGGTFVIGAPGNALVVEGDISGGGDLKMGINNNGGTGYVAYSGGANTVNETSGTDSDNNGSVTGVLDYTALLNQAAILSTNLENSPTTGTYDNVARTATGTNAAVEVFDISGADLNPGNFQDALKFADIAPGATIVLNIAGTGTIESWLFAVAGRSGDPAYTTFSSDEDARIFNVVYNFYEASEVIAEGDLNGLVLVPNGNLVMDANLNGRAFVGGDLTHSGMNTEMHNYPFLGELCSFCPSFDFGDLPDLTAGTGTGDYQTLSANGGPSHIINPDLYIGATVDAETDGQQGPLADGDDNNGDDEDGFTAPTFTAGQTAVFSVPIFNNSGSDAEIYVWFDWNANGELETGERYQPVSINDGTTTNTGSTIGSNGNNQIANFEVAVPSGVTLGTDLGARFRLSTDAAAANPTGAASDGEVEDYLVQIEALGTIGDFVWYDTNADGVQDGGEPGLEGATVTLTPPGSVDLGAGPGGSITTTTAADGSYLFEDLPAGDYTVAVDPGTITGGLPSGVTPADLAQTFDADGGLDNTSSLTLGIGEDNLLQDFGYDAPGSIGDQLFVDENGDGLFDGGDTPIGMVTVTLTPPAGVDLGAGLGQPITTETAADGTYLFEDLPAGDYTVTVDENDAEFPADVNNTVDPDGGNDGTSMLSLGEGADNLDQDFGYRCSVTVTVADPFTVCGTQDIDLTVNASITPVTLGGTWSTADGDGIFLDANGDALTAPYTFGTAVTYRSGTNDKRRGSVTLTLSSDDPAGICDVESASVTINILKVDCGSFPWNGND